MIISLANWKISFDSGHVGSWVGVVLSSMGMNSRRRVHNKVYPLAVEELSERVSSVDVTSGLVIGSRYSRMENSASPISLYRSRPTPHVQST